MKKPDLIKCQMNCGESVERKEAKNIYFMHDGSNWRDMVFVEKRNMNIAVAWIDGIGTVTNYPETTIASFENCNVALTDRDKYIIRNASKRLA